ncbi:MAG TPA: hypothetical protein PLE30_06105 [Candidatus Kapabacteria bacterium]|nr:hypothetical protein [Candidatus Kapabacteria bacterium]
MATLSIESNGRLEKTAVYYNGEQIAGIKELFLNLDEDGTFDAIIQYEGTNKQIYTKSVFLDYLDNIRVCEPAFTEEEARALQLFTVESEGYIDDTYVYRNDEQQDGIVSVMLHIKATENAGGLKKLLNKSNIPDTVEFKAEITYRNEDESLETERIF